MIALQKIWYLVLLLYLYKSYVTTHEARHRKLWYIYDSHTLDIDFEQIDSSTIDSNVEFVHSQFSCILTSQVST